MTSQSIGLAAQPAMIHHPKSRILIITEEPARFKNLQRELEQESVEVTNVTTAEEVLSACCLGHDVAIVDVLPNKLISVLDALRQSVGYAEIPILVDSSRLSPDPSLAGVLPFYRAMPCNYADLVRLARRRVATPNFVPDARPHYINRML